MRAALRAGVARVMHVDAAQFIRPYATEARRYAMLTYDIELSLTATKDSFTLAAHAHVVYYAFRLRMPVYDVIMTRCALLFDRARRLKQWRCATERRVVRQAGE